MIKINCTTTSHNTMKDTMNDEKNKSWLNPRLFYLQSFIKPLPQYCPECEGELDTTIDEDETICIQCGLVCSSSIEYAAGIKIDLPHGRH